MNRNRELRYRPSTELRIQNTNGEKAISGVAVVFNSPSVDLGGWTEYVSPGAFTETLRNGGQLMLRDHDPTLLLGNTKSGTLVLSQDSNGLNFRCTLPNTQSAQDVAESIRRQDLSGVSFGFTIAENGDKWSSDGKGNVTRTLLKVDLAEISVVSFPAYPAASVSIRSCPAEIRSLLEKRKTSRTECSCPCPECEDGNCDDCSEDDCDCDGCDCQDEERSATTGILLSNTEVNKMYMTLALKERQ